MSVKVNMAASGLLLACAALFGTGMMSVLYAHSAPYIEANKRRALQQLLQNVLPQLPKGNLGQDKIRVAGDEALDFQQIIVYRIADKGAAMLVTAPNGYSGPIELIIGMNRAGTISGVRVLSHKETPGLGDAIDIKRSNWIKQFNGKSIVSPVASQWSIKKDGGDYDAITGASVTSRAVIETVKSSLLFARQNSDVIWEQPVEVQHAVSGHH